MVRATLLAFAAVVLAGCKVDAGGAASASGRPAKPVPEPAAWAMMILGAGFIGAELRLRRRLHGLGPTPSRHRPNSA